MKRFILIGVVFLSGAVSLLKAGSVVNTDGSETTGDLTLTGTSIRVGTGVSPTEINLSDVLEADFGDTPFQLDFYTSAGTPNQMPATWKAQDIGPVVAPSTLSYAAGIYTVTISGVTTTWKEREDRCFFAGQPWTGNGQWTIRVKEIDSPSPMAEAGLMVRDSVDPGSIMLSLGATSATQEKGIFRVRKTAGEHGEGRSDFTVDLPIWFRLTRYGANISAAISSDGKVWQDLGDDIAKLSDTPLVGFFVNAANVKTAKVTLDMAAFTPPPSLAQLLPGGVLLQSGTFLAGSFNSLDLDPASPEADGQFNRNGRPVGIPRGSIAAVTLLPTTRSQIADMGSHVGLLMKNGDVMDGTPEAINGSGVRISSILLGDTTYDRTEVRVCILHALQGQPAPYEIRLKDGSVVNATSLNINNNDATVEEASGLHLDVPLDEIAQFRAGPALAQSLAALNWKATPPVAASSAPNVAPVPVAPVPANATPPANAPQAANAPPAANAVPDEPPPVLCLEGKNQEQIMETSVGTSLAFPLPGRFRMLGMRVAVSPDSPPASNVIIRILADGREIARTPPFRPGDEPRFMDVTLQDPRTLTIEAVSPYPTARVYFIDPVVVREN